MLGFDENIMGRIARKIMLSVDEVTSVDGQLILSHCYRPFDNPSLNCILIATNQALGHFENAYVNNSWQSRVGAVCEVPL